MVVGNEKDLKLTEINWLEDEKKQVVNVNNRKVELE